MAMTQIGEVLVGSRQKDYLFRPSFAAMTRIGSPKEIVQVFYDINHDEVTPLLQRAMETYGGIPAWLIAHVSTAKFVAKSISAAINVLAACCDDECSALTGEMVPSRKRSGGLVWHPGLLPFSDIVVLASSLMAHGIIGKAKVRQLQRNESGNMVTEFKAIEYINSARVHFGMPYAKAERLTMTEFILLLNAKYPEQKGYTREEYDQTTDDFFARRERRKARKQNNQASA